MSTLKVDNLLLQDNTKGTGRVLEMLTATLSDSATTTVEGISGTYTFESVTHHQALSTSYAELTGSRIAYLPPQGTKIVRYQFSYTVGAADGADGIASVRLYVDDNEITNGRRSHSPYRQDEIQYTHSLICNGNSTDLTRGIFTSWDTAKTIHLEAREHSSSVQVEIHNSRSFDGGTNDQFCAPTITLTAIG